MKEHKVLGLQYYGEEMKDYRRVKEIAKEHNVSLSKTGKLLINRGLTHTDNPEPLIKEKVVYQDRIIEKPVEKIVYKDKIVYRDPPGKQEHLKGSKISRQLPSGDKLKTGDKTNSPSTVLEVKKSPVDGKSDGWIGEAIILGVIGFILVNVFK